MVPSTFDICVIATIFVRGESSRSKAARSSAPSSVIGAKRSTAPFRSRRKCQGTMFEWCSISVSTISSPAAICGARPDATMLIACVPPLVKTISPGSSALTKRATVARAFS